MKLSVITINYNNRDGLRKTIYDYYLYNSSSYLGKLYNAIRRSKCNIMFETIAKGVYKALVALFVRE